MTQTRLYDNIVETAYLNCAIKHIRFNYSLTEQDKLIDEVLIRRLEGLRDKLLEKTITDMGYVKKEK